ncbi:response regulator [Leptolyngbya sp. FACHB-261]|uniref:response regulator n=1 Tax=Leptolyngbya sp. FACHB-261 TaxID=2692806 RepID=UPI0016894DA9|nr:response regulator [Leptolyngbya sp. FACHB-261]MBD2104589.1 response regulator [Leptolyngbya sp. FACHB-261]
MHAPDPAGGRSTSSDHAVNDGTGARLELTSGSTDPVAAAAPTTAQTDDLETWVQAKLAQPEPWALLYCDLQYFSLYEQLYGVVAGKQMLRTWSAIIEQQAAAAPTGCLPLGGDEFLVFTPLATGVSTASAIAASWQSVSLQFYTQQDRRRSFLIATDRRGISGRFPLVQVNIGVVLGPLSAASTTATLFSTAIKANLLARQQNNRQHIAVLPTQAEPELPVLAPESTRTEAMRTPRILVVEPDAALAFLLQTTLEMRGYWVTVTSSAREALSLCRQPQQVPDLVIIDLFEPGQVQGLELCQLFSSNPEFENICRVATVSDADREDVLNAGADLFVPKPFEIHDLLHWIDRLVQLKAQVVDLPGIWPSSHLAHPIGH